MAKLEVPGWNRALYLKDWDELNRIVVKGCKKAARDLEMAWGRGGSQGTKKVFEATKAEWNSQTWDGYFSSLSYRIHDLTLDGKLYPETESAALNACAEILALDRVPHWDHVDDIQTIRTLLKPDQAWEDGVMENGYAGWHMPERNLASELTRQYPDRGMGGDDDDDYM